MSWTIANKTCVITGANDGIGKETALGLARMGAHIVLVCRDRERGRRAQDEVARAGRSADLVVADLASAESVRGAVPQLAALNRPIDVLICNAGIVMRRRQLTAAGHEMTFAVNHLGHFLLVNLLRERLEQAAPSRIVVVASQVEARGRMHFDDLGLERGFAPLTAYDQSKLANVLFTYELARRLKDSQVTANCLHPGVIATNLLCDYMARPRALRRAHRLTHPGPVEGARPSIRLASDPALEGVSGKYFTPNGEAPSSKQSYDVEAARRLWQISEQMVGLA